MKLISGDELRVWLIKQTGYGNGATNESALSVLRMIEKQLVQRAQSGGQSLSDETKSELGKRIELLRSEIQAASNSNLGEAHHSPITPSFSARPSTSTWPQWLFPVLCILGVLQAISIFSAIAFRGRADCSATSTICVDSGWLKADNTVSHELRVEHKLGRLPRTVTVYFSQTADDKDAVLVSWRWGAESGNPVQIRTDDSSIRLAIWSGSHLNGIWYPSQDRWNLSSSGYFRVFAER